MKPITYLVIALLLFSCGTRVKYDDPIPVHEQFQIHATKIDEERTINVWLPPSYGEGNKNFPVMYMADGGIVMEDFPHIANTLDELITKESIPPFILVGIENTNRRRDLTGASSNKKDSIYCPLTDGASEFRHFITEELFQEIEKRYRVNDTKGIIGESLSGLFVMETFFLSPEKFDIYIAMDPSLWWNNHYLVRNAEQLIQNLDEQEKRLWFAGSNAVDISTYTQQLEEKLKRIAPENLNWKYVDQPKEKHHTIFRATKEEALIWSLNP
ncbi:alpha/beta hydrolase [Brumimicrobium aurantiacum]|uniref:Alpha/beta hydrolase n=1 Tax=Brumimicrobium aurantiacum TaxID=1737063 RepID=A0A3E1EZ54_9FLAO|nr:alpha/beta hydrolase-fold protein [Brumimicrobium aurantiacum]RFC54849.1 alpha/beta hydrolase [Brumimicrobium aurantiacum]